MAEADDASAGKVGAQACAAVTVGPGVVYERHRQPADLDRQLAGQARGHVPAVAIAGDTVERSERPELVEQRNIGHVARVQDAIRPRARGQQAQAAADRAGAARGAYRP